MKKKKVNPIKVFIAYIILIFKPVQRKVGLGKDQGVIRCETKASAIKKKARRKKNKLNR